MTTLADSKLSALETLTGNTGHINDLEAEYLVLLGATAGKTIVDMWGEVFDNAAIAAGQHNDRWMAYMDSILSPATEDQYNDREREFWDGGGTPIGLEPPGTPFRWWDFTDGSVVFSDVAGTTPSVDGGLILRVNNKGTDNQDLIDAGSDLEFHEDVINGQSVARGVNQSNDEMRVTMTNAFSGAGMSMAIVHRTNAKKGADTSEQQNTGAPAAVASFVQQGPPPVSTWELTTGLPAFVGDTLKPVIDNEWNWAYTTHGAGGAKVQSSGSAQVTGGAPWASLSGGGLFVFAFGVVDVAEVIFYEDELDASELTDLIAYFEEKYGGEFPIQGVPPTQATLIHHYDFTDNLTVFRNPSATQLARDGDTIRVLRDKGTHASDLTTPNGTDAPTYRVAYVSGENVADFSPGANSKPMSGIDAVGTTGTKGLTNAIIFRVEDAIGPAVQIADWSTGVTRLRILRDFGAGNMTYEYPGPPGKFSEAPHVPGNWYLWYFSATGVFAGSDDRSRLSGELQIASAQLAPTSIPAGDAIILTHLLSQNFQIAEWAVWEGPLSDPELAALEAYADAKYGTLPHGDTSVPAVGNLLHHVDASDASTVFSDAAGLIPAVNGDTVERITNKGTRGTPFLRVGFGGVEYKTGVLSGENVIEFQSANGQLTIAAESPGLAISTTGCTLAAVVRRRQALGAGTGILWRWTPSGGTPGPGLRHASTSEDFITIIDGIANETLKAATVLDTWYLIYISIDPAGAVDDAVFGSPGPEVVAAIGNPTDIPDLADVRWGTSIATMEQAEAFFWDRPLTLTERAQLVAYVNGKYGTLPHL